MLGVPRDLLCLDNRCFWYIDRRIQTTDSILDSGDAWRSIEVISFEMMSSTSGTKCWRSGVSEAVVRTKAVAKLLTKTIPCQFYLSHSTPGYKVIDIRLNYCPSIKVAMGEHIVRGLHVIAAALDAHFCILENILRDIFHSSSRRNVDKARPGYYVSRRPIPQPQPRLMYVSRNSLRKIRFDDARQRAIPSIKLSDKLV